MTPTEAAYFAGIIDGEGTVTVVISDLGRSFPQLRPRLMISSTDYELLEWLVQFGGNVYKSHRKAKKGCKFLWTWTSEKQTEVIRILEQVQPYLILKAEQSILLQEFCIGRIEKMKQQRGVPGYSKREIEIHERMRVLNKRGDSDCKVKFSEARVQDEILIS